MGFPGAPLLALVCCGVLDLGRFFELNDLGVFLCLIVLRFVVSVGVGEEEEIAGTVDMPTTSQDNQKVKAARTQAMQRLGRDNLGGATAQQTADAMDKA